MQNEIAISKNNLPVNLSDLSKFVLIGREKLVAVRAEIRAIEKIGLAEEVRKQKLQEAQAISEAVLDAEVRIGQLMSEVPKERNNNPNGKNQYVGQKDTAVVSTKKDTAVVLGVNQNHNKVATVSAKQDDKIVTVETKVPEKPVEVITPTAQKTKTEIIKESGFTPKQVQRFQTLAANPEIVEQAKAEAICRGMVFEDCTLDEFVAAIDFALEILKKQAEKEKKVNQLAETSQKILKKHRIRHENGKESNTAECNCKNEKILDVVAMAKYQLGHTLTADELARVERMEKGKSENE